jgi:hypothetical protein
MGMSEATDAVVIVISEQTGKISVAVEGELHGNIPLNELQGRLEEYLSSDVQRMPK